MEQEIDELVDEWTPEPLVTAQTPFEEAENDKRPVIVGYVLHDPKLGIRVKLKVGQAYRTQIKVVEWS